jgi:hypothetical protein
VWLPVIGPAAWVAWRVLARGALKHQAGWTTSLEEVSSRLGLGSPRGAQSGIARTLRRLERFGIVRTITGDVLVVRCQLGFVSQRQLQRLSPIIQVAHDRSHDHFTAARGQVTPGRTDPTHCPKVGEPSLGAS